MKHGVLSVLLLFVFGSLLHADESAVLEAGAAYRVITPDPLLPVSGGIGPSNPARSKRGELNVRAIVLRRGSLSVALASVDLLGFPAPLIDKVRARVPDIPPHHILMGATHTHSAPDPYGFPDGQGGTGADFEYLEWVCAQAAAAINEAFHGARPAHIKAGTSEARGRIAYNAYAPALFDPRCHVVQFLDAQDSLKPIATLVNYAVHPEVLGSKSGFVSPDLVGPLYERIHSKGGGMGIFINSAQGAMVTADNRDPEGRSLSTWEEYVRIGHLLGDEALRIAGESVIQKNPMLRIRTKEVAFPIESPVIKAVMAASPLSYGLREDGSIPSLLSLVELGNVHMFTVPGEALPNIGSFLKRKMKGEHNLILGLTHDAFGYILTREDWGAFSRYDYVSRTSLGESTGSLLVDYALELIEERDGTTP